MCSIIANRDVFKGQKTSFLRQKHTEPRFVRHLRHETENSEEGTDERDGTHGPQNQKNKESDPQRVCEAALRKGDQRYHGPRRGGAGGDQPQDLLPLLFRRLSGGGRDRKRDRAVLRADPGRDRLQAGPGKPLPHLRAPDGDRLHGPGVLRLSSLHAGKREPGKQDLGDAEIQNHGDAAAPCLHGCARRGYHAGIRDLRDGDGLSALVQFRTPRVHRAAVGNPQRARVLRHQRHHDRGRNGC